MPGTPGSSDLCLARLVGSVNLTMPLMTLLGLADEPGEVTGFGPVDAGTARTLAGATAHSPATRWCLTVTDDTGRVIGHGCRGRERARADGPAGRDKAAADGARNILIKLDRLAFPECDHRRESRAYQLSPRLRHLIEIRDKTCSFPGSGALPCSATKITQFLTIRADDRANVTSLRSAERTTRSNRRPAGGWSSHGPVSWNGPRPPAGNTVPARSDGPVERHRAGTRRRRR